MKKLLALIVLLATSSSFCANYYGSVVSVDSVATLTNRPPSSVNPVINVVDAYGNGYNARWRWVAGSTNTANGGTYLAVAGNTNGLYEIEGWDGDIRAFSVTGTSDDSAKFQSAINVAATGGGIVRVPENVRVLLGAQVTVTNSVKLLGPGTLVVATNYIHAPVIIVTGTSNDVFTVDGLQVDGQKDGRDLAADLSAYTRTFKIITDGVAHFRNSVFRNIANTAILLARGDLVVRGCQFLDHRTLTSVDSVAIPVVDIYAIPDVGDLEPFGSVLVADSLFANDSCPETNYPYAGFGVFVTPQYTPAVNPTNVARFKMVTVTGNKFRGYRLAALAYDGVHDMIITDNEVDGYGFRGLGPQYCDSLVMTGNTIRRQRGVPDTPACGLFYTWAAREFEAPYHTYPDGVKYGDRKYNTIISHNIVQDMENGFGMQVMGRNMLVTENIFENIGGSGSSLGIGGVIYYGEGSSITRNIFKGCDNGALWWTSIQFAESDPTNDLVLLRMNGVQNGDIVMFEDGAEAPPSPLTQTNAYYVINATTNSFQVSTTRGGAPVDITETKSRFGIVGTAHGWEISDNALDLDVGGYGMYLEGASHGIVARNRLWAKTNAVPLGILVTRSYGMRVEDNWLQLPAQSGVYPIRVRDYVGDIAVIGNQIEGGDYGIFAGGPHLYAAPRMTYRDNRIFRTKTYGAYVGGSASDPVGVVEFTQNRIYETPLGAEVVYAYSGGTFSRNTIVSTNGYGFRPSNIQGYWKFNQNDITSTGASLGLPMFNGAGTYSVSWEISGNSLTANNSGMYALFLLGGNYVGLHGNFLRNALGGPAIQLSGWNVGNATSSASADTLTITNHGLSTPQAIYIENVDPGGITTNRAYYVTNTTANTFQITQTVGGAVVDITGDAPGISVRRMIDRVDWGQNFFPSSTIDFNQMKYVLELNTGPLNLVDAQRDAVTGWRNGSAIWNTQSGKHQIRRSGGWLDVGTITGNGSSAFTNINDSATVTISVIGGNAQFTSTSSSGTNASRIFFESAPVDSPNFTGTGGDVSWAAAGTNITAAVKTNSVGASKVVLTDTYNWTGDHTFSGLTSIDALYLDAPTLGTNIILFTDDTGFVAGLGPFPDELLGWGTDDVPTHISIGSGLLLSGGVLSATGSGGSATNATAVSVNGTYASELNLNGTTPTADPDYIVAEPKLSGTNLILQVSTAELAKLNTNNTFNGDVDINGTLSVDEFNVGLLILSNLTANTLLGVNSTGAVVSFVAGNGISLSSTNVHTKLAGTNTSHGTIGLSTNADGTVVFSLTSVTGGGGATTNAFANVPSIYGTAYFETTADDIVNDVYTGHISGSGSHVGDSMTTMELTINFDETRADTDYVVVAEVRTLNDLQGVTLIVTNKTTSSFRIISSPVVTVGTQPNGYAYTLTVLDISGQSVAITNLASLNVTTLNASQANIGSAYVTNSLSFNQSSLAAHSAVTNFVVDLSTTLSNYRLLAETNAVNFLHATNVAAGRMTTLRIAATGGDRLLTLPATWERSLNFPTRVTNNTAVYMTIYGYGSDNTNVSVTAGTFFRP